MKKLLSIIVAALVLVSATGAMAAEGDLSVLFNNSNMLNGEVSFEASVKFNQPLSPMLEVDQMVIDAIENFKFSAYGSFDYTEDLGNIKMDLTIDGAAAGESISLRAWYDIDMSDIENPMFRVIIKMPEEEKYMYMDYSEMFSSVETNALSFLDPEKITEMAKEIEEQTDISGVKQEFSENTYYISVPQDTVLGYFKATAKTFSDLFANYFMVYNAESQDNTYEYMQMIDEFFAKLETIKLFAEDAVTMEVTLDDAENIISQDMEVNVQGNIAAVLEAFEVSDPAITKENSDIDATLSLNYKYDKINEGVLIEFPVLTPENSVNIMEAGQGPGYEQSTEDVIIIFVNDDFLTSEVNPIIKEGRTMVPLRTLFNAIGVSDEDISFKEDLITVTRGSDVITFTVGSNVAYINGKEELMDVPAEIVDERTLVPARFFAEALGFSVDWVAFDNNEDGSPAGGIVDIRN